MLRKLLWLYFEYLHLRSQPVSKYIFAIKLNQILGILVFKMLNCMCKQRFNFESEKKYIFKM